MNCGYYFVVCVCVLQVTPTISEGSGEYSMGNRRTVLADDNSIVINHPIVVPNRVHFPKTGRRLPQALIIGAKKCGTRALLEMLNLHPEIQKANEEVHFFDRDENYVKGLEWYRKKMPHSFSGQITIEKSPSYFITPEVSAIYLSQDSYCVLYEGL